MRTHRFVGATSREVLNKVKNALGDDALILSNRPHDGGIEVIALSAADAHGAVQESPALAVARRGGIAPAQQPPDVEATAQPASAFASAAASRASAAPARLAAPPAESPVMPYAAAPAAVALVAAATAPVAAGALAATSALAASVARSAMDAIPALANTAITRSTASPSMMAPPVIARAAAQSAAPSAPEPSGVQPPAAAPGAVSFNAALAAPAPAAAPVASAPAFSAVSAFAGSDAGSPRPGAAPQQAARNVDAVLSAVRNFRSARERAAPSPGPLDTAGYSPAKAGVMHELLSAGFSAQLSRQVADDVCADDPDPTIEDVAECIERELWTAGADEIISRGGIYALVGPTGVGKTTTVAKLAARAVVRFGASKVALLTTDSYRVGAHDQLRIYGRILSVPVHAIRDARDLATALAELKDRHIVLIDTIGMSQRDRMVAEQAAMLSGCGDVKRLLLVPTTANARTLEQVVCAYKKAGVDGCILTKTDEAGSIAPALDAIIRHQLPLHYVTDGQRVPEDLQLPAAAALVREALKSSDDDAFALSQDEMPFMMPLNAAQRAEGVIHG